ncbi:uncharacterized protein KY384_009162 [Bacidia gigantensis]|uniref:uncharacterized protein n=1 Tax=Bacidia gigantensis TaxID=2732470 RepID=UPI001D0468CB|nr:uncharacterized protein KY384_009162 [Bacidia gigantensis]KAG8525518.1 hypothetical protein KY384_009162 [Bacidia gigantensis]
MASVKASNQPIPPSDAQHSSARGDSRDHAAKVTPKTRKAPSKKSSRSTLEHLLSPTSTDKLADKGPHPNLPAENLESSNGQSIIWLDSQIVDTDAQKDPSESLTKLVESIPAPNMAGTHTRRNANGTVGSVYSGNKIRHLKKEDGIPLWRKDIQLEFLRRVFEDDTKCFTKTSDMTPGHSFADIYIEAMANSSKTSKVLKEKLLSDRRGAMSMAMICLLVNVGRMNTTLNCKLVPPNMDVASSKNLVFPEMRAQLRTFHAIPSLQANQDPNAYKQLQDAPRLKSILKGASEDKDQPSTIEKLENTPSPRTNPVHLIFLLSQYAPKVSEAHFIPPRDFFDLVMRPTLSSKSRACAFLWLMWWYLESDFSADAALHNPFGEGQRGEDSDGLPIKVPAFEHLTEAQADAENVDTEEEMQYGERKRVERRKILEEDETVGPPLKRQRKGDDSIIAISDTDPTRSPSPPINLPRNDSIDQSFAAQSPVNEHGYPRYPSIASKNESSANQRLVLKTRLDNPMSSSPPLPPGSGHPVISANSNGHRRPRPQTSHQKAVDENRKMHIDHILHRQMQSQQSQIRRQKRRHSSTFGMMVMNRLKDLPDMYDTDDENSYGPGGLVPNRNEIDDYGEEAVRYRKIIDRAIRRLDRDQYGKSAEGLVHHYEQHLGVPREFNRGRERPEMYTHQDAHNRAHLRGGSRHQKDAATDEQLDDLDLDLLGENRNSDQEGYSEDSEGEDADMTEDDIPT